jgi:glycosyltransferase involved in cell wall biosynthesis
VLSSAESALTASQHRALAALMTRLWQDTAAPSADPLVGLAQVLLDTADAGDLLSTRKLLWQCHIVLLGSMPDPATLDRLALLTATGGVWDLLLELLPPDRGELPEVEPLGGVLVDVTKTANSDDYAGIPRVVRELVRRWGEPPGLTYVTWDEGVYRRLTPVQRARLGLPAQQAEGAVAPDGATVVVLEVLRPEAHAQALDAAAAVGAARVRGVMYDLSALVLPSTDATRGPFLHHLSALAHADRVSCISESVAADLSDFWSILDRSGRGVGEVAAHLLPVIPPDPEGSAREAIAARLPRGLDVPVIATVSTLAPRKNHGRLLAAAEQIWAEGVDFQLVFVEGTGAKQHPLLAAIRRLQEAGRPIALLHAISDGELRALYELCRATVYISLAEGYGLPAAESLALGTPVIVSEFGSMGEIARDGGVITVNPRDVQQVVDALRRLVTDPSAAAELGAAALKRTATTWDDYALAVGTFLGIPSATGHEAVAVAGGGHAPSPVVEETS